MNTLTNPTRSASGMTSRIGPALFTADLYKVDSRLAERLPNPQAINVEWIFALFGGLIEGITGQHSGALIEEAYPSPLARLAVYRRLGLEFSSAGWAALYEDLGDPVIESQIAERFAGRLAVVFEMPPYLEAIFARHGIPFVALCIHPIRFLPDYMFGIRSNVPEISARLCELAVPPSVFGDFARISAARTVRVFRSRALHPGAAVFCGQIEIDSSLIHGGRIYGEEDIEAALLDLLGQHERVYFKAHPHLKKVDQYKDMVAKLRRCEWLEANIYDLFARPEIELFAGLSSGSLFEAKVFGRRSRAYIARRPWVDLEGAPPGRILEDGLYVAAPPSIFLESFWAYVLGYTDRQPEPSGFDPTHCALRDSLNMKWGR